MNHDISHCKGKACQMKKSCYRYFAYRELMDKKDKGQYSFIEPAYNNNECANKL